MKYSSRRKWPDEPLVETEHKWVDLLMVAVGITGVFAVGEAYRNDWLIPKTGSWTDHPISALNLSLPFAPIFLVLLIRRQSLATVWISSISIQWKLLAGVVASLAGVACFLAMRGELNRGEEILKDSMTIHSLIHAPAVFLEAVAIAFLFVRLKWVTGGFFAVLIGSLLFAAAHIPSGIQGGRPTIEIVQFFFFNTALAAFIFGVVAKSRDVIWIAIPHYFLDVAIGAFD